MTAQRSKIALVTGASRGLGYALSQALSLRGFHIVALARTVGALEELDDEIQNAGGQATLVPLDLTHEDGLRQICRAIHERWGRIDLMAHCAIHAAPLSPVGHIDEKELDRALAANIRGTQRLIANAEPLLRAAAAPRALFFNDPVKGQKFHGAYGLTKSAQMRLARSWQAESEKSTLTVQILTPPPMPTALRARFYPGEARDTLTPCRDAAEALLTEALGAPDTAL